MGSVYKRGKTYWIQYYRNGKPYRESTKSRKASDAKRLLRKREGEISDGKLPGICFDRVTFDELAEDFLRDRRINGHSVPEAQKRIKNLLPFFEGMRVPNIDTTRINRYVDMRLAEKAASGTVNRELSALKRMLHLGAQHTPPKVNRVPHIEMLEEDNVREGYFHEIEFEAFRDALPSYLRGHAMFGYLTGWRREEVSGLEWSNVDMDNHTIRLNRKDTKNKEARLMKMEPALCVVMEERLSERLKGCPYVFHKDGKKIKDIRFAWSKACRETSLGYGYKITKEYAQKWEERGLPSGPLYHDLRRTAVRAMTRAGVNRRIAMKISGHKTESVFERYNITDDEDLKEAAVKMDGYRNRRQESTEADASSNEQGTFLLYYLLSQIGMSTKTSTISNFKEIRDGRQGI